MTDEEKAADAAAFKAFTGTDRNYHKNKPFRDALYRVLTQDSGAKLRLAAQKLLDNAAAGDLASLKELADRTDGKAAQSVAVTDPDGAPLFTSIERVIIDRVTQPPAMLSQPAQNQSVPTQPILKLVDASPAD